MIEFGKQKMMTKSKYVERFVVIYTIIYVFYLCMYQLPLTFNNGLGWDGVYYYDMALFFKGQQRLSDSNFGQYFINGFPFNQRIGIPYLVSKLSPSDLKYGFLIVNMIFTFSFIILIFLTFKKIYPKSTLPILFVLVLVINPHILFRMSLFCPILVDSVQFFYTALFLFFYKKPSYIVLVTILLTPFKEGIVLLGVFYFLSRIIFNIYIIYVDNKSNINIKIFITKDNIKSFVFMLLIYLSYTIYLLCIKYYYNLALGNGLYTIIDAIKENFFNIRFYLRTLGSFVLVFGYSLYFWLTKYRHFNQLDVFIVILFLVLPYTGSATSRIISIILPFLFYSILLKIKNNEEVIKLSLGVLLFAFFSFPFYIQVCHDDTIIINSFFTNDPFFQLQVEQTSSLNIIICLVISGLFILGINAFVAHLKKRSIQKN